MYLDFFGLTEKPFALTPNTDFLVSLPAMRDCMNLLQVALAEGEGFIKITGEVGTGKTLLCRSLLRLLEAEPACYQLAWLPNPALSPDGLRRALAHELHLNVSEQLDEHSLLAQLNERLIELARQGRSTVLLIDEAQVLPPESLEALRLLTNLETERCKLLQVVLFGQPELDATLARSEFRQLRQRITFSASLQPLGRQEVGRYVEERLRHAGHPDGRLLDAEAIRLLTAASGGIPRLINILAHKALMAAFGAGRHRVQSAHVQRAAEDTEGARAFRRLDWSRGWPWLAAIPLLLFLFWLLAPLLPAGLSGVLS